MDLPNLNVNNINMQPENVMFHPSHLPSTLVPYYDHGNDLTPKIPNPSLNDFRPPMPPMPPMPPKPYVPGPCFPHQQPHQHVLSMY